MSILTKKYSGVVVNQNQKAQSGDFVTSVSDWYYQDVFLPENFSRGTNGSEQIIPRLSGIQVLVGIAEGYSETATVDWVLEYNLFGNGWLSLASGTSIGAHSDGDKVWLDVFFNEPVDVSGTILDQRLRFGIRGRAAVGAEKDTPIMYEGGVANVNGESYAVALIPDTPYPITHNGVPGFLRFDSTEQQTYYSVQQGVTKIWYSAPNPLALYFCKLYGPDGTTAISDSGDVSMCFRLLGLVADEGVDFLGNSYRSVVINASVNNTSRIDGSTDASWLSKPNPSRFAVESLYYDVRPRQEKPRYGAMNDIVDPSFEGASGTWTFGLTGGSTGGIETGWADRGTYSARLTAAAGLGVNVYPDGPDTIGPTTGWTVSPGQWIGIAATFKVTEIGASSIVYPQLFFYDSTGTFISASSQDSTDTLGTSRLKVLVQAPANAALAIPAFAGISGSTQLTFHVDSTFFGKLPPTIPVPDFDGDTAGYQWVGAAHNSASVEVLPVDISDDIKVVDNILVDPETPGIYFNVYYSAEGDPGTSEAEWENKLWRPVPGSFHATERKTHALPEPILAKYIKVEFSHLQARSYSPGDLAKPIKYKKHPKWVLDYFLMRLKADQDLTKKLNNRVAVIHDAIDLAFNYYLDDLNQEPANPVEVDFRYSAVTDFLSQRDDLSDQVDSSTLDQIKLSLNPYKEHPTRFSNKDFLLGKYAISASSASYPVEESRRARFPEVAQLRSQAVIFENDFPVMSFYITCRHKYREITASFSHDRAYFAGIKEIAFTRERYTSAFDTVQYQEPAGDLLNTERNDFVYSDGVMVIE